MPICWFSEGLIQSLWSTTFIMRINLVLAHQKSTKMIFVKLVKKGLANTTGIPEKCYEKYHNCPITISHGSFIARQNFVKKN